MKCHELKAHIHVRYGTNLFWSVEIRNVPTGKEVIDVDEEPLISDLRVREQQDNPFFPQSRCDVHGFQIFFQVADTICRRNNDLHYCESRDEGR